jgi:hypothetical protein
MVSAAMTNLARDLVRSQFVWPIYQRCQRASWTLGGRHGAPPHIVKEGIIRQHGKRLNLDVLVETGTYMGDMVWALRNDFRAIHSIELDPALANRARNRFARYKHIKIYEGDSAAVLPVIIEQLDKRALFWLDGHFSGGITAKAALETPIALELEHLLARGNPGHVILIDDARAFSGEGDYPTMAEIIHLVGSSNPSLQVIVADDVIRITPRG